MNWDTLSDKDKTRLVLQYVMHCEVLDVTTYGYHSPDLPKGRQIHWPIAYVNTDCDCWQMDDIGSDPQIFDPLHDWNDTWLVVGRIQSGLFSKRRRFLDEVYALVSAYKWDGRKDVHWSEVFFHVTPEIVCKAALQAILDTTG